MQVNTVIETSSTNDNNESVRDYSIPFIESALLKADEDPKELMSLVTHYVFVQLNAQKTDSSMHK